MRERLGGFLTRWHEMLEGNTAAARGVLDGVLSDRIRFAPDVDQHRYTLTIPVAFDRILIAVVPEFAGLTRNDGVPSGIRTRVLALKGPRPGPLDDGDDQRRAANT
jgi:hypothetical protein